MARIPFSADEKKQIHQAARAVWNEIASDIIAALAEQEGRDTATRDEVIDVVLDCDRVTRKLETGLAARVRRADPHQIERIVRDAFPYEEYE